MTKKRYVVIAHAYDRKGRILAVATNSYTKTHPSQAYFAQKVGQPAKQFAHAEILCMLRCKDKRIHKLMVYRYDSDGNLVCAKPCPICQEAIAAYRPNEVWYSDYGTMVKL